MSEEQMPPAIAGLEAARRAERAERDASVAEELETVDRISGDLAQAERQRGGTDE